MTSKELACFAEFALAHSGDGVLGLDAEGRLLYVNAAACRILSRPAQDLLDQTLFRLAPELNAALWRELWKEIRSQDHFAFEMTLEAGDQKKVGVDMTVYRCYADDQEWACAFFRDVEERKRLKNLEQEFVSTVSHELRTPMTVIREGVSQVVEGLRGPVSDGQRRALEIALNGMDRLGRIINELLDLSKLESGKLTLRRERMDVAALAREVSSTFQTLAQERSLDLRVTTPAGAVPIYADRDRLIQVLTNLISNAFKFTEKGKIEVSVWTRDNQVEIVVQDTGIGFDPGDTEKVFNKFEQLGRIAVTGEKGTGLGLSICRAICELHHGRIWAETAPGDRGARFVMRFPQQSGYEIFMEEVAPILEEVGARQGSLSVIVFEPQNQKGLPLQESEQTGALALVEALLRQERGRLSDLLVKDAARLYVALPSTVKREAERVAERVTARWTEELKSRSLSPAWVVHTRIYGFPEEAATADAYVSRIAEKEAA